jgi:hypothetical protein
MLADLQRLSEEAELALQMFRVGTRRMGEVMERSIN